MTEANGRIDIFHVDRSDSSLRPGWYWMAYDNPRRTLKYEGGPFATKLEAELDLAEYLHK